MTKISAKMITNVAGTTQRSRAFARCRYSYCPDHATATPGGSFLKPVEGAIGSLGSIFGMLLAFLIVVGAVVGPVVLGVLGVRQLGRRANARAGGAEA